MKLQKRNHRRFAQQDFLYVASLVNLRSEDFSYAIPPSIEVLGTLDQVIGSQREGKTFQDHVIAFRRIKRAFRDLEIAFQRIRMALQDQGITFQKIGKAFRDHVIAFRRIRRAFQDQVIAFRREGTFSEGLCPMINGCNGRSRCHGPPLEKRDKR